MIHEEVLPRDNGYALIQGLVEKLRRIDLRDVQPDKKTPCGRFHETKSFSILCNHILVLAALRSRQTPIFETIAWQDQS